MTPMFVETQSSQGPESLAASQLGAMKGKLRATQTSLEFTQTQTTGTAAISNPGISGNTRNQVCSGVFTMHKCFSTGRRTAYNWLTGSSVDTLAEYTPGSEYMSSLLVFDKKAERQVVARRPTGEGFGMRRLTATNDEVDSRSRGQSQRKHTELVYCHLLVIYLLTNVSGDKGSGDSSAAVI